MTGRLGSRSDQGALLSSAIKRGDGLNVITRRASIGYGFPVRGFRPTRAVFARTLNVPKPRSFTISPCARARQTSSIVISTISFASLRVSREQDAYTASRRSARVAVFFDIVPSAAQPRISLPTKSPTCRVKRSSSHHAAKRDFHAADPTLHSLYSSLIRPRTGRRGMISPVINSQHY